MPIHWQNFNRKNKEQCFLAFSPGTLLKLHDGSIQIVGHINPEGASAAEFIIIRPDNIAAFSRDLINFAVQDLGLDFLSKSGDCYPGQLQDAFSPPSKLM